jgi:core-2/I-Branching enzyme
MKMAYLIMTHENPQLLQRTIRTLSFGDEECAFFIHLDRKTPLKEFSAITGQNVWFCERRIPVYWGEFSQVEAILSLVRQAIESPSGYDYCILITGSCYPLRTGGYIRKFLEANPGSEYMEIVKVPGPGYPLSRFRTIRYPSNKPVLRFAFRVLAKIGLAQRDLKKYLGGLEPYSGEGAWALSREACQYVLGFMAANPHVEKYFRHTFAPDEVFFHTILGNSKFLDRIRRNLVYAVWPGPANGHPAVISFEDVAMFEAQDQVSCDDLHGPGELLFARKLNDGRLDLVSRVDAMIERKEGVRLPATNEVRGGQTGGPKLA